MKVNNMIPKRNGILVLPDPVDSITKGGIILPEQSIPVSCTGTVVETGEGLYDDKLQQYIPSQVKTGDRLTYQPLNYTKYGKNILMQESSIYTCNGTPVNDYIAVIFDEEHNRTLTVGNLKLARPDTWIFEQDEKSTKYDTNRNLKDTRPQIATIIKTNANCSFRKGDTVYCHYLQYGNSPKINIKGVECSFISYKSIFFTFVHDGYEMCYDTYLGERVIVDAPKTASGIYMQPYAEITKAAYIRLTHIPHECKKSHEDLKVGDIVFTGNDAQYEINVDSRKYIKLTSDWILYSIGAEDLQAI